MDRRRAILVCWAVAAAAAGCDRGPSWRELSLPADGVRVELPGPSTQTASKTGGRVYRAEIDGLGYLVDVETLPNPPADDESARRLLEQARDDMVAAVPGTRVVEDRDVSAPGRPGRTFRIERAQGETALVRIHLIDGRYVSLFAGVRSDPESAARAERFFGSFRPLGPPISAGPAAIPVVKRADPVEPRPAETAAGDPADAAPEAETQTYVVSAPPSVPAPPPEADPAKSAEPKTAAAKPAVGTGAPPNSDPPATKGGPPAGNPPTGNARTVWRYVNAPVLFSDQGTTTGEFRQAGAGWVEHAGAAPYQFTEAGRTPEFIEIVRTNGFRVRLFADHSDYRRANDPVWRPMYPGGWATP